METEDSTLMLPLYVSRQQMALSGDKAQPRGTKDERSLVLSTTDYSALLADNGNLDFYRNSVSILGRSFLSPLAASGNTYYNYYLADSISTDGGKLYVVHFKTKNPFYATFNGEMVIDSATFALRTITAEVPAGFT